VVITDYYFIIRTHIIVALTFDVDFHVLFDLGDKIFIRVFGVLFLRGTEMPSLIICNFYLQMVGYLQSY